MDKAVQSELHARVRELVNQFLIDEFEADPDILRPDAAFRESLNLDSLDYVDMVVIIENVFGFKMKAEDFQNIRTFQDFYDFIARHQKTL
ncbi:MAG: phosphopantetheine-binding protein [Flavobacteriales bacterium]|nr:phosphopantetheine-binding protein [Flavobacteriales bacterium]